MWLFDCVCVCVLEGVGTPNPMLFKDQMHLNKRYSWYPVTQEITRVLGVLCGELQVETKYLFLIILVIIF